MKGLYHLLVSFQDILRGLVYRVIFPLAIRRRARRMTEQFLSYILPGTSLLDIGAGTGDFGREIVRQKGIRCIYLDRKRLFVHKPLHPLVLCDAHELAFCRDSFDTILLVTMLHHCRDPKRVIEEAKRVCRGHIVVVEDSFRGRWERYRMILKDTLLNFELFGHPRTFYAQEDWERLFSALGLEVRGKKEFWIRVLWVMRFRNVLYVLYNRDDR